MTETEWLAFPDPTPMLEFLQSKASDRKLRLFACACCRRVWHLIPPYHRRTVEVAESFSDGLATWVELNESYQVGEDRPGSFEEGDFDPAGEGEGYDPYCVPWPSTATSACGLTTGKDAADDASNWSAWLAGWTRPADVYRDERKAQTHLLRDLTGNPFRSIPPKRRMKQWKEQLHLWLTWNGGTIMKIAQAIYDERAFDRMSILADALEEAGCTNPDMLNHCRQPGEHVRGCWVVDLLLGKE
jgi:hypothetical protein